MVQFFGEVGGDGGCDGLVRLCVLVAGLRWQWCRFSTSEADA